MHSLGAKDHASAAGTTPGDDPPTEPATAPAAARRDDTTAPSGARRSIQAGASIDHYKLIEPLGRGGMGDVWLARDVRLGRRVALKFLHGAQRWQVKRFVAEARTTARLTHENIVSLYDIGEHRGSPYMALEYVRGQSLRAWLGERAAPEDGATPSPAVPPRQVIELVVQVVRALVYAHEAGVIHRDLKLANVMVTDTGAVKVLDFGIAKLMVDAALADSISTGEPDSTASITAGGKLVGTLAYMSPEQMGAGTVDPRTDLWAVGIMLHMLAVGRHPLGTRDAPPTTDALLGVANLNVPMPSVRESHPALARLAFIIDACLAKRKEDRIGSARELLALLEAALENRAPLPDDVPPYLGLSVFQESDAGRFFGRKQAVHQAFARLREQPLLAVIGPSGAGKSSFVRAGLLPALKRREGAWESLVLRPGARPLNALAELLFRHGELGPRSRADMPVPDEDANTLVYKPHESLRSRLEAEPAYLGELLRARARRRTEGVILFCDQLEDVFTRAAPNERAAFFACLCGAAGDDASPVRVIVTMRSDFLDRLTDAPSLAELAGRGVLLLGPMTRDELRTALVEPARLAGHRFESEEMVTEMLDTLGGAAGALPLLQFTAARLWESRDQARRLLTWDSYRQMGGVAGALASHADAVLASMSSAERRAARSVLLRLVTPDRTRAVAPLRELDDVPGATGPEIDRVVTRLVDARLISIEAENNRADSTVELVHESLIDRWAALRAWLDEERHDARFLGELRSAASQWENHGREHGFLWRDEAAHRAQSWLAAREATGAAPLTPREKDYLEAVIAFTQRAKKGRQRIVAALFSITVLVVIAVGLLAIDARKQAATARSEMRRADELARTAEDQAAAAREDARQARNATRMAAAAREMRRDPTTVLWLLREIEPGPAPPGWSSLARWARGEGVALRVLPHDDECTTVAVSPDGERFVSGSRDGTLRIWSARAGGEPRVLRGHDQRVSATTFTPDGKRLVSASWDGTVRVWDLDGQAPPRVLRGHQDQVTSVAASPDGHTLVSASHDKTVRVWDLRGTAPPLVLKGHEAGVYSVAVTPDGSRIVSASRDGTVRVWSAGGQGAPLVLKGHQSGVISVAVSPDGKRILSASRDQTLRLWSAGGKGDPLVLKGHTNAVWSAAFSPDGKRIASASWDGTVRVWNASGKGEPRVLAGHDGYVFSVAWSPDSRHVLSGAADKTARVWDLDADGRVLALRGHEGGLYTVDYSPDGARIVSASSDRTVRVWSADGSGTPLVLDGHESQVTGAVFSPDGRSIASSSDDGTVRIWSATGSGTPGVLRGHEASVGSAAWSPDGKRIASASDDGTVRVWRADGSGSPLVLRGHERHVLWASWSPDGARIVSASEDRTVRVWNADGSGAPLVLRGHTAPVYSALFSPDGAHIFSASEDTTVRRWSADGAGDPLVFRGHESLALLHAARLFSPDGRRFVSTSNDGTARVWSAAGDGEPMVLRGSGAPINSASWSPDGRHIAAALEDRSILVWSDLAPLEDPTDPRLWAVSQSCMPLAARRRLLGFSDAQSRADLERCQARVASAAPPVP